MAMRKEQRLLRVTIGYGYEALAAAGRMLRRAAARRQVLAAAVLSLLVGFAVGFLRPWPASKTPVTPQRPPTVPSPGEVRAPPAAPPRKPPDASPASPAATLRTPADFGSPLAGRVTAGFGWRRDPVFQDFRFHPGVDLAGRPGQGVAAAAAGRVVSVRTVDSDYEREPAGWEVMVDHPGGWRTCYRFAGLARVKPSQPLVRGQTLGVLGGAAKLHFGLYRDGEACQPLTAMPPGD